MSAGSAVRRFLIAGLGLVLVAGVVVGALWGDGYERSRTLLSGGGAWLASGGGLVTLLDGASELVVGSVRTPSSGVPHVVQTGTSALVVDAAAGTVTRVDGATYEVSPPVRFGGGGALQVLAGNGAAYVVDAARKEASIVDPNTLEVQQTVELAATPGDGQAVVDGSGRLWVVDGDGGGLSGFEGTADPVHADVGDASSLLVVAQQKPVLLDRDGGRAGLVDRSGAVPSWTCMQVPDGPVQLLGSKTLPRAYAAASQTGTLHVANLDGGADCAAPVSVGSAGDEFGPLIEDRGLVLVPNVTTGRTAVVDVVAGEVVAEVDVLPPGGRLELLAKDGLVFYNDLAGDQAGVIRFDGSTYVAGPAQQKYSPAGDMLASGNEDITAANAPVGLPPAAPNLPPRTPRNPTDPVTGGVTPTDQPPVLCEDGTAPPCAPPDMCEDGTAPPCAPPDMCEDGTAPPCTPPDMCEDGSAPPCQTETCEDGTHPPCEVETCEDGSHPPCEVETCEDGSHPPCEVETCEDGSHPPCEVPTCPDGVNTPPCPTPPPNPPTSDPPPAGGGCETGTEPECEPDPPT